MQDAPYSNQLNFLDIGWLAGLYEGEGCATVSIKQNARGAWCRSVRVSITMTDRDIIERVYGLFPTGRPMVVRAPRKKTHKAQYEWRLSTRAEVARFLRTILPLLGERRSARALDVLEVAENPNYGLGSGHRGKKHCPNGHLYTPENTRANSGHRTLRRCKACETNYRQRRKLPANS